MPSASPVCTRKNAKTVRLIRIKHNYSVIFQVFSQICAASQAVKAVWAKNAPGPASAWGNDQAE
jgi:hypothetical protein